MMYNLERFIDRQKATHSIVVEELSNGQKRSHWMWFTFPQLDGLGRSTMSQMYSIKSIEEAYAYIDDSYLRNNLYELCNILLSSELSAYDIFGNPDHHKLKSCMTLFDAICPDSIFGRVLDKFFFGERCRKTISMLNRK